jgi:hypothetical protein
MFAVGELWEEEDEDEPEKCRAIWFVRAEILCEVGVGNACRFANKAVGEVDLLKRWHPRIEARTSCFLRSIQPEGRMNVQVAESRIGLINLYLSSRGR